MFVDTAEGTQTLNSLAQATNRFFTEGKKLALEFSILQDELVRPFAGLSPAAAGRKLRSLREVIAGEVLVLEEIINNPSQYTDTVVADARKVKLYGDQLVATYDAALRSFGGTAGTPALTEEEFLERYGIKE
jgi:hypothetical protein